MARAARIVRGLVGDDHRHVSIHSSFMSILPLVICAGCGATAVESPPASERTETARAVAHYVAPGWDDRTEAGDGIFDTNLLLAILADTESAAACTSSEVVELVLAVTVGESSSTILATSEREEDRALGVCLEDAFRDRVQALRAEGGSVLFTVRVRVQPDAAP